MVRKRYTEEQVIAVLSEVEAGSKTGDLFRKHGMSEATFWMWKAKYARLTLSELKGLRLLEDKNWTDENRRLRQNAARQASREYLCRELQQPTTG